MVGEKPIKHMKNITIPPTLKVGPSSHTNSTIQQAINLKYISVKALRNCCFSRLLTENDGERGGGRNAMQFYYR
jgi:hypothetical protein